MDTTHDNASGTSEATQPVVSQQANQAQCSRRDHSWAVISHIAAFGLYIFPFGNVIGPLIVWAMKKDVDPEVRQHGAAAFNFRLTWWLAMIAIGVIFFISMFGLFMSYGLFSSDMRMTPPALDAFFAVSGPVLLALLVGGFMFIANMVLIIVNAVRAHDGRAPRYPLTIPFLR